MAKRLKHQDASLCGFTFCQGERLSLEAGDGKEEQVLPRDKLQKNFLVAPLGEI